MNQPKYNYDREKYLEIYALFASLKQQSKTKKLSQHQIIETVRQRISELCLDEKYFHAQYRNLKNEFYKGIIATNRSGQVNYQETLQRQIQSKIAQEKSQQAQREIHQRDQAIRTKFLKDNGFGPDRTPLKSKGQNSLTRDVLSENLKNDLKKVAQQALDEGVEIHNFLGVQEYFSKTIKKETKQKLNDAEMTFFLKQYNSLKTNK